MLINGGAGVALLAFMSQMEKDGVSTMLAMWLPWSLSCFVVGVFAAALATGAAYFAQQKYYFLDDQEEYARAEAVGDRWRRLCIGLVVLSYLLYVAGGCFAFMAFSAQLKLFAPSITVVDASPAHSAGRGPSRHGDLGLVFPG